MHALEKLQGSELEVKMLSISSVLSKIYRMSSCFVGAVVSLYLPQVRATLIGTARAVPGDYIGIDCGEFLVRTLVA